MPDLQPLLASKIDKTNLHKLRFPMLVSPKIDGIRMVIKDGLPLSRKFKKLPNLRLQEWVRQNPELEGLDGEIIYAPITDHQVFNQTQKAVMTIRGPDPVGNAAYLIFDRIAHPDLPYETRRDDILHRHNLFSDELQKTVEILPQIRVDTFDQLVAREEEFFDLGFEGAMCRSLSGRYKFGRSTVNEGILLKLKRFEDTEAEIIGAEELMHNANERTLDNFGRSERSSHQANLVPSGSLGSVQVRSRNFDTVFSIGTGFSGLDRTALWSLHLAGDLISRVCCFTYQPSGMKDAPRFPVWKGFRYD